MVKKFGEEDSHAHEFVWILVQKEMLDGIDPLVNLMFIHVSFFHDAPHFETCKDCGNDHMMETGVPTRTDAQQDSYVWDIMPMTGQMTITLPISLAAQYEVGSQYLFIAQHPAMEPVGERLGAAMGSN